MGKGNEMQQQNDMKRTLLSGFAWAYGERLAAQGVTLVVSIVLARLIAPEQFGVIAIVTVLIAIGDIFVMGGFGNALVCKKDADDIDCNTAFVFSLLTSVLLYGIVFWAAPAIAKFYNIDELTDIIRVMGLRLPIASLNTVQHAVVQRTLNFKKFFFSTLGGTVISGIVGVALALMGYGIWALVAQYMTNTIIDSVILLFICEWKPGMAISVKRMKFIYSYGWKVLAQRFINTMANNIQNLIIGKQFSSEDLAFYNNGAKIPSVVLGNIFETVGKIMFPAFSKSQEDLTASKTMLRNSIVACTFILAPVSVGMIAVSDTVILLLFTDIWSQSIPYMKIFCLRLLPRPFTTIMQQIVLAYGWSDIVLKIEIVLDITLLASMFVAVFFFKSVMMIAWGTLVAVVLGLIIYIYIAIKHFKYSLWELVTDAAPSYICAAIMGGCVYLLRNICTNKLVVVAVQVVIGIAVYLMLSFALNRMQAKKLCGLIKQFVWKK
jgi:Membrane protein involved in the export of O-antigen and teichoic acid